MKSLGGQGWKLYDTPLRQLEKKREKKENRGGVADAVLVSGEEREDEKESFKRYSKKKNSKVSGTASNYKRKGY